MRVRIIKDPNTKMAVVGGFDKSFKNNKYELLFNTKTGVEVVYGINDNPDPFYLELPSLLDIGVMGHCQNKCYFCYQGHTSEPNMKLEDFKNIIDQVKHHTNQVALGGRGDPNHHENFKEIVVYARENGVVPNYTTSGINLTDEQIEISKLCGAVAVSDYGTEHTYNAIERLIKAGIKTNIHLLFTHGTFDKSVKILYGHNPWKKKKISLVNIEKLNAVIFLLFKPQGAGKKLVELIPTTYNLSVFADLVFNPKTIFKVGMDSCLVNHVLKHVDPDPIQKQSIDTCEGARMSAYITPDMKMTPCSFADKALGIPIGKKDISYIWNKSMKFKSFRKVLKKNPNTCPLGL